MYFEWIISLRKNKLPIKIFQNNQQKKSDDSENFDNIWKFHIEFYKPYEIKFPNKPMHKDIEVSHIENWPSTVINRSFSSQYDDMTNFAVTWRLLTHISNSL